jgi:hypothetical protein
MRQVRFGLGSLILALLALLPTSTAQGRQVKREAGAADGTVDEVAASVQRGIEVILSMREGEDQREWPYEGVYRVGGRIPIGYRIGGTALCAMAVAQAPGYAEDARRGEAVRGAVEFICRGRDHPGMSHEVTRNYDVRGWGYTYAVLCLLTLRENDLLPEDLESDVAAAVRFYIDGIAATEIPTNGGWNYARRAGFDQPAPTSPFMTASTLQALFLAAKQGVEFDARIVERGLDALERSRQPSGAVAYAGRARNRDRVPGAVGRMLVTESTLHLAGRGSAAGVRSAVDAFIVHWGWLEKRRKQNGTHVPPYGIAPYYFFYAHYYAAQAIELLPQGERGEYRRRLLELLFSVREADGRWNDRVFDRSANYGTAMAVMALVMPTAPPPAAWTADAAESVTIPPDANRDANKDTP